MLCVSHIHNKLTHMYDIIILYCDMTFIKNNNEVKVLFKGAMIAAL